MSNKEEIEECESSIQDKPDENGDAISHDCIEIKGHDGPHICYSCSETW